MNARAERYAATLVKQIVDTTGTVPDRTLDHAKIEHNGLWLLITMRPRSILTVANDYRRVKRLGINVEMPDDLIARLHNHDY